MGNAMSQVSRAVPSSQSRDEDPPVEIDPVDELPSPLAEIAARSKAGSNRKSSGRKERRPAAPAPMGGRKRAPRRSETAAIPPGIVVVGTLAGMNDAGEPLVRHPLEPGKELVRARTLVQLESCQIDREVAIAFEENDPRRPIVLGTLWRPEEVSTDAISTRRFATMAPVAASVDGDQLVLTAEREIVLRCGDASITLTRAGKVLIRGTYLLSRSSGINRIKGGAVQIN
jgi:hypothetical protein